MDYDLPPDQPEEAAPYWTARRIVYIVVTLITLLAFLIYVFIVPLIEAGRASQAGPRLTPTVLPRF